MSRFFLLKTSNTALSQFIFFFLIFLFAAFFPYKNLAFASSSNSFFGNLFQLKNREHIQMVGSSTVYPFASIIAESFGRNTEFKTPIVEANGTGGGFKLFCAGVGYEYPDFANASRKIEKSEIKKCAENGVRDISEIKIGYDGIVLANALSGQKYNLTKKQIFLALAAQIPSQDGKKLIDNPNKKWNDIDKNLPNINIAVYGPPSSSGTRDAFAELVLEGPCLQSEQFIFTYKDEKIRKKKCHLIRSDGYFIEAGENDNLIVQKLKNDPEALGIFGFSFLEENRKTIQPAKIDNIVPSFDSIVSGQYSVSRPLFIYFKKEHLDLIKGMQEFVQEIRSPNTIGKDGYLLQKGLIPLADLEIEEARK